MANEEFKLPPMLTQEEFAMPEPWDSSFPFNQLNNSLHRVRLHNGKFLRLESPVPTRLLEDLPADHRDNPEFNTLRYTAATCSPDDFGEQGYTVLAAERQRSIELLVCITMYNEDQHLFCRTLHGLMMNLKYLCKVWGENGWQKVVVCIIADGREHISQSSLDVLTTIGVFQPHILKAQVANDSVQAHIFEVV